MSLLIKAVKTQKGFDLLKRGVINYINLFGADPEIGDILDKMKKLHINVNLEGVQEGDPSGIYNRNLPDKIWESFD